jgi:hypothetical protein
MAASLPDLDAAVVAAVAAALLMVALVVRQALRWLRDNDLGEPMPDPAVYVVDAEDDDGDAPNAEAQDVASPERARALADDWARAAAQISGGAGGQARRVRRRIEPAAAEEAEESGDERGGEGEGEGEGAGAAHGDDGSDDHAKEGADHFGDDGGDDDHEESHLARAARHNLRKLHRRQWTHSNLDGTVEPRVHRKVSPYKV